MSYVLSQSEIDNLLLTMADGFGVAQKKNESLRAVLKETILAHLAELSGISADDLERLIMLVFAGND